MPVKKDESGNHFIELQFEMPATPEQVWQAIATGPGITAWFVPSEVEERQGGKVVFHLGPGMDSNGTVTVWDPPRELVYEEPNWSGDAPPLATQFIIEARSGQTCTVRVVTSLFVSEDQWDKELDSMEKGWAPFFEVLRIYLENYPGQPAASVRPMASFPGTEAEAWDTLLRQMNLVGAKKGDHRKSAGTSPEFSGVVEHATSRWHPSLTLRIDSPTTGVALIGAFSWGADVKLGISFFYYGPEANAVAAKEESRGQKWLDELVAAAKS